MNKCHRLLQTKLALVGSVSGGLLITILGANGAIAMPGMDSNNTLSQTNPKPTIFNEAPYNRSSGSTSPLNPNPSILNEYPYNRSQSPIQPVPNELTPSPLPAPVSQPPLPENQQSPIALVEPVNGQVNITLMNHTNAVITYQAIADTEPRPLTGGEKVTLQSIDTPVTITFVREDGGLLKVSPQATAEGLLEVMLDETTNLNDAQTSMRIQATGGVFLN